MANKPFAIQGSTLTIGGVSLQAGTTGVVLPGVTQAVNYKVEEVDERDGNNPDIFGSNENAVTIIDNAEYLYLVDDGDTASADYVAATYSVGELDDGEIHEINVETEGVFLAADKARVEAANMWATLQPTPFTGFNSANWTQIPFRPKMRAGEVENVGGGNADTGNFTFSEDTIINGNGLTLQTDRGTLAIGTQLETPGVAGHFHIGFDGSNSNPPSSDLFLGDDYNYVKLPGYELNPADHGVEIGTHDRDSGGNSHVWRFGTDGSITFPDNTTQTTAYTGQSGGTTGDANVWVQTFETVDGAPSDVVGIAASVEYDSAGNAIALFSHYSDEGGNNYYSVGKYTTTGTKIWTARFDDEFNTDGWGLAVDNDSNSIYVAGESEAAGGQTNATLTKLDATDGSITWSETYDFGFDSQSSVVDVASDGNPVMVGYAYNGDDRYVATTKVDAADGSIIWSRALNGQNDEEAYGMAVGPSGEVVAIGYMDQLDTVVASYPVTPLTGSGVNALVINRSDLNSATFTDAWQVAGTGITGTIGVNAINVYEGLTSTVRQGSGAVFEIADNGDGTYGISGMLNNGTNYLAGHKILVLGTDLGGATPANDCVVTVDSISEGGLIFQWSVAGTAAGSVFNVYSPLTGTNYQTGSGLTFDFFGDSGSTYTQHNYAFQNFGTNYVTGDVVTISGALLGGTSPANDLIATVGSTLNGTATSLNSFTGTQQTTTYRVRTDDFGIDFSGVGAWTLNDVSTDTDDRMLVVKYDSAGVIQWQKAILFDAGFDCRGADADIDSAGNIYVTGSYQYSFESGTTSALSILKLDSTGVKQWSRRVVGDCDTFGVSVVVGADDKLYLSAMTGADTGTGPEFIWVAAKYGIDGTVEWQRLIDNTTGWSFTGNSFFNDDGGSNIAVKQDYVLLAGGFGDVANDGVPQATLVQVAAAGDVFSVGDWDFKAASFSGVLNSSASDITVVNADKTDTDNAESITTSTVTLTTEVSNFLLGTLYSAPGTDDTTLPYLELTNSPFIIQPVVLGTPVTVSTPGDGSGAQVEVIIGAGPVITSITVASGSNYVVGQRYRINSNQIAGNNYDTDSIDFEVATVDEGMLDTVINAVFTGAATNTPGTYSGVSLEYRASPGDVIDDGVTLVRSYQGALFNIEAETEYDQNTYASPLGTEWNNDGWGNLLNLQSRSYGTFRSALNNNIGNEIIGAELVMHDTINDKYYKFSFSNWGQNNGGSYAYTRTQVEDPNYFKKEDGGEEVDEISAGLHITRGNNGWLYNPLEEEGHDDNTPTGSVWNNDGWEDLSDVESRTYVPLETIWGGNFNGIVGSRMIMKDTTTDKYWAIEMLGWTQGNGGGFSYLRYELDLTQLQEGITFSDGTVLKSAEGIGRVKLTAAGDRRIEEVHGYKSVSVAAVVTTNLTTVASGSQEGGYYIWIDTTATTIDDIISTLNAYEFEFSLDNTTWYAWTGATGNSGVNMLYGISQPVTYLQGDTVYFRYKTGGDPVTWWSSADLPGGSGNFRGAVIDYHAYTDDGTWIGTIHIVADDGDEHITHTEVSSGGSDMENDDLWVVQNEGTVSYRRIDGESATLKIQWTAKVFYGSETYD